LENNNGSNLLGRRQAIQYLGVGLSAASGLALLGGCKSGDKPAAPAAAPAAAAGGSCQEKIEVDEAAKNLRRVLQYKEKADNPEKRCTGCAQFDAGKYGECGGCKLFAGAVNPEGGCLSFAPKGAIPAPGTAPAAPGAAPAAPAAPGKAG